VRKGVLGSIVSAVLVAGLLVASGCGSGGGETVTKAEFVKEANAICNKWGDKREKLIGEQVKELGQSPSKSALEKVVLAAIPNYETAAEELAELETPEGDEEKVAAIVSAMDEGAGRTKADPGAAVISSTGFEKANKLVAAYGLDQCEI
jgi:hypothetical protein